MRDSLNRVLFYLSLPGSLINNIPFMKMKLLIAILCLFSSQLLFSQKEDEGGKPSGVLPALIRGPYLQSATSTSLLIRWRTDASCRSRVRLGILKENLKPFADDSALVTEHQVLLQGLAPNTRYYYSIGGFSNILQEGPEDYFYTLPPVHSPGSYRIGVFGDCG